MGRLGVRLAWNVSAWDAGRSHMSIHDPESLARHQRAHRLCRELSQLLQTSVEQRRTIDDLLGRLERVMRSARGSLVRATGRSGNRLAPE